MAEQQNPFMEMRAEMIDGVINVVIRGQGDSATAREIGQLHGAMLKAVTRAISMTSRSMNQSLPVEAKNFSLGVAAGLAMTPENEVGSELLKDLGPHGAD